jgi:hypothetical protein
VIERLSASNAAKHMACHASANLEAAIPGFTLPDVEDTAASSKGTAMHNLLELAGVYTPREMLGLAQAMEYVARLRMQRRFNQLLEAESDGWWLTTKPKTRADVVLYVSDQIEVVDYKFGKLKVDVLDNAQLKFYALSFAPLAPKAKGVTVHIVQPFADNIESVYLTADELDDFKRESIEAETAILGGDVTFGPSDHCKFCPANPHGRGIKGAPFCPALMQIHYPMAFDADDALQ